MENNNPNERYVEIRKGQNDQRLVGAPMVRKPKVYSQTVIQVRRVCIWIMILTVFVMASLMVISAWIGDGMGDVLWKSFITSLIVVAASAFMMAVIPLIDKTEE